MKIILLSLAGLIGLLVLAGLVLYLLGARLPERHRASITFSLPARRDAAWAALTDYARMAAWWPAVKSVRFETRPNGEVWTWNTDSHGQQIAFRTKEEQAPARLVREIMGDDLPFGGTWTYELAEDGAGTRVTLTEDGFIKPPFFRVMMKYFIGEEKTMRDFATHFEKHVAAAK
jgi:uncharacterized protein YndB with AHSA1/START domain